jgi:hypothetical protein
VRQARSTLEALEAQQNAANAQIDLFAVPSTVTQAAPGRVEERLATLDPDMLSPKEALQALYELKALQAPNELKALQASDGIHAAPAASPSGAPQALERSRVPRPPDPHPSLQGKLS